MQLIRSKYISFSMMLLGGSLVLAPGTGSAQKNQGTHPVQSHRLQQNQQQNQQQQQQNQQQNRGRFSGQRGDRDNSKAGGLNNGRSGDRNRDRDNNRDRGGRWNNSNRWDDNNRRWGNSNRWNNNDRWGSHSFRRDDDKDRDHDRREHHRDRDHDHDKDHRYYNNNNFGLGIWGGYSGYPYGYYDQGAGAAPYGYGGYDLSPYDAGYSEGVNAGQLDKVQGNLFNPRQYERSSDPDYFQGFVDGYEEGYRR